MLGSGALSHSQSSSFDKRPVEGLRNESRSKQVRLDEYDKDREPYKQQMRSLLKFRLDNES